MQNAGGKSYWGVGLDHQQFREDSAKIKAEFRSIGDSAESEGARIDKSWSQAKLAIGGVLSFNVARNFVGNMIKVRSEFESTEASFKVFLRSGEAAKKFMNDLQDYAFHNVFEFADLTQEAANLLAFRTEAGEVINVIDQLSNIAAGANKPLSDLVNLYNKAKSNDKLQAIDIQQWGQKGVNIAYELAEAMGTTEASINEMVSSGEIRFSHLQTVIEKLTSRGGDYFGMMEEKMKTLGDGIGLLEDNIANMYNELGEKNHGVLKSGIDLANWLVENYELVGKTVGQLITIYGSYKAAVLTTIVLKKAERAVLFVKEYNAMAKALGRATANQIAFNTAAMKNPYVWIGVAVAAIGGLVATLAIWKDRAEEVTEAEQALNRVNERTNELVDEEEAKINRLLDTLHNANMAEKERIDALKQLKDIIPGYNAEIGAEGRIINENTTAIKNYLTQLERKIRMQAAQEELEEMYRNKRQLERQLEADEQALADANRKYSNARFTQTSTNQRFSTPGMQTLSTGTNASLNQAKGDAERAAEQVEKTNELINDCVDAIDKLNKEIETTAVVTTGTEPSLLTFGQQVEAAATRVNTLKGELAALLRGEGNESDFADAIKDKRAEIKAAEEAYNLLLGKESGKGGSGSSRTKDYADQLSREARERERMIIDMEMAVKQAEIDAMNNGIEKTLAANELNYRRELEQIRRQEEDKLLLVQQWERTIWESMNPDWEAKKMTFTPGIDISNILEGMGSRMAAAFGNGNVDLLARPLVDAAELVKKGWEEAGEGIATVYSSQYGIEDADGNVVEILVTPILPDGEVLSPDELDDYVFNILQGTQDILDADDKGIVIAVGVKSDGSDGDVLHQLQEQYYDLKALTEQPIVISQQTEVLYGAATQKYQAESKRLYDDYLNELLGKYRTFEQQRQDVIEKYAKDESIIRSSTLSAEDMTAALEVLAQKRQQEIKAINEAEIKETQNTASILVSLFEDTSNKSVKELRGIISQVESLYDYIKNTPEGELEDAFGISAATLRVIKQSPDDLEAIRKALASIKKEVGGKSPFTKFADDISTAIGNIKEGGVENIGKGLTGIGDAVNAVSPALKEFGNDLATIFNDEKLGEDIGLVIDGISGMGTAAAGVGQIMSGDILGGIQSVVSGVAQVFSVFTAIHDRKREKEIKRLQEQVDALQVSYDKLGRSIEKAYSADAAELIQQQDELLRQQKEVIQRQIASEKDKKKTDWNRIKEWEQAIADIDAALEETKDRQIEAIIGSDVQAAIDEFAQAYVDAWAAGEDRAASMKDVVKKMVKSAVTELVKSRLSPEVQEFMAFLAKAMEDGVLTAAEERALDEWENRLYAKAAQIDEQFGKWITDGEDTDSDRTGSSKGFNSMDQDTGNELNGRFTAFQGTSYETLQEVRVMSPYVREIAESTASIRMSMDFLRTNTERVLNLLSGIEANTSHLGEIKEGIKSIKGSMDDINTHGVTIKR